MTLKQIPPMPTHGTTKAAREMRAEDKRKQRESDLIPKMIEHLAETIDDPFERADMIHLLIQLDRRN